MIWYQGIKRKCELINNGSFVAFLRMTNWLACLNVSAVYPNDNPHDLQDCKNPFAAAKVRSYFGLCKETGGVRINLNSNRSVWGLRISRL